MVCVINKLPIFNDLSVYTTVNTITYLLKNSKKIKFCKFI